jgi:hydrogenase maturation protein HypF
VGSEEAALLSGRERPIVLLRRSGAGHLASSVAPENPYLGLLLPYSPLHHLLFAPVPGCWRQPPQMLVMTSGNLSEEPICFEYPDAVRRLGRVADGWLTHDRPIHVPCDDSVVRLDGGNQLPVRRSRGYAPLPIRLPFPVPALIAAGGELKNTFCVASGPDAWVSQHIGDMGSLETLDAFERSVDQMCGPGPSGGRNA